jgi:hypothetical protein
MKSVVMLNDDCYSANSNENAAYAKVKFNESYAHFLEAGQERGLDITIAHFSDYKNRSITNGWSRQDGICVKTGEKPIEFMYDKFPAKDQLTRSIKDQIELAGIGILNNPSLEATLKDKQSTHDLLPNLVPITYSVRGSVDEIIGQIENMRSNEYHPDLDTNTLVFKPRKGFGGKGIFIINGEDYGSLSEIENEEYVFQPFL